MDKMKKDLEDLGFADTRTGSLAFAISQLHVSISQLDREHLRKVYRHMPSALELARLYAKSEGGLNTFEELDQ